MTSMIANRYHILSELGQGGMGTVYQGIDTQTEQTVAIKRLKTELATPELIERFKREGEALRELNHPNIVKMLDAVEENGNYYLIVEYLTGGDLNDVLKQDKLSIERVLQLAIDICDALTRAHRLNIIHRDLKPANVLIASDGTPRLTDFGIAHIKGKQRVTASDAIIGTVDYLAPEILNGTELDPQVDVWAFGVMLFEMLAGKRPFTSDSIAQTLMAIVTQPTPDLETLCPDAPIALVDLVYRMLEKDPHARIASVRHVGAELEDILQGRSGSKQVSDKARFATPTPDFLHRAKHNLPAQTTPFVGRDSELSELARMLNNPAIRLITIVAQGGMGKTRLSLEAAERQIPNFEQGVYCVELAPLSDVESILPAISNALGYQFKNDGRESKQQILDFLQAKELLLVMDNFEHLLDGAVLVSDLLKAAPKLKILVTSRHRLDQSGESLFHLSGMDFPDWETPEDAFDYAAVKLFMNSAVRAKPDFELTQNNLDAVARICRFVQGMPLGIVLAASWLGMLSPQEVAEELQKGLDFLETESRQIPERQRSMRAVMEYSWQLMTPDEQTVFTKLSVFRGGFTREAAEAVAEANLRALLSLVNKSLLHRDSATGRYEIHELLRQYAEEHLDQTGIKDVVKAGHRAYFAEFMVMYELGIKSQQQLSALRGIDADFENVRAAWYHALEVENLNDIRDMMDALFLYCTIRSRRQDRERLFQKAQTKWMSSAESRINSIWWQMTVRRWGFDYWTYADKLEEVREQITEAIAVAARDNNSTEIAFCKLILGYVALRKPDIPAAIGFFSESVSLYRDLDDSLYQSLALHRLGYAHAILLDADGFTRYTRESLELARSTGNTWAASTCLANLASRGIEYGNYPEAQEFCREALATDYELNDRAGLAHAAALSGQVAFLHGDRMTAQSLAAQSHDLCIEMKLSVTAAYALAVLLLVAVLDGDTFTAERIARQIEDTNSNHTGDMWKMLALSALDCIQSEDLRAKRRIHNLLGEGIKYQMYGAIARCLVLAIPLATKGINPEKLASRIGLLSHESLRQVRWFEDWKPMAALIQRLQEEVGLDAYVDAWERGKSLDLETVAKELLIEFGDNQAG